MRDFQLPGRSPVLAANGMVATSHPLAAAGALAVLKDGGTAADAAVAGALMLNICEPAMCGLGGDCFALIAAPDGGVAALNGSGRAPAGLSAEALRARGLTEMPVTGDPACVTLPGAVAGFATLADRFGRLGLDRLCAPAIDCAEAGVPVAPRVAWDWARNAGRLNPDGRRFYLRGGAVPQVGDLFRAPEQAEVLRRIARDGPRAFYEGEVAEDIVTALQALGGPHTVDDLAATAADWATPVAGPYRGADLLEHPPNGQGATAILLAGILEHFDIAALPYASAERLHILAEAMKLAYDARDRFIADADHAARAGHMLDPGIAAALAALIDPRRAMPAARQAARGVHRDTILITAADRDGMMVSLIYSIYWGFGSGIATPRFGLLLQNRGTGFTLEAGHPNEAGPGKRPLHTIIPALLREEGRISMAFGVMGGAFQPAGHAQVLSNLRDHGMDLQEAIDAPRAFAEAGEFRLERGFPDTLRVRLAELGHKVVTPPGPLGGGQAITIDRTRGVLTGASDPRKDGLAIGY